MKKKGLIIIFLSLNLFPFSENTKICAQNLVPNGSFENVTSLPVGGGEIYKAQNWSAAEGSPDLYSSYSTPSFNGYDATIPSNCAGFQYPRSGYNYAGIATYVHLTGDPFGPFRELIQVKLTDSLKKNHCYLLKSFWVLSNLSDKISSPIGALLTNNSFFIGDTITTLVPQIIQDTTLFYSDTLNWQLFSSTYIAKGGERFLTLGNFRRYNPILLNINPDLSTAGFCIGGGLWTGGISYMYLDDVSFYETYAPVANDTTVCYGEETNLGFDENVSQVTYTWQPTAGLSCVNCPNPKVTVTNTTTYTLTTKFCNTISTDSVKVTMKYCPNKNIPNVFSPNYDGVNDVWQAVIPKGSTNINCNIYNRWGLNVYSLNAQPPITNAIWDGHTTSGQECSEGIYFYTLTFNDSEGTLQQFKGSVSLFR